jgi:predicted DNA-binding transcriptional regulator AlpA
MSTNKQPFEEHIKELSKLITLKEYAERKNKSLKTIYNWIKAGKLKPVIIGKHQFIKYEL